LAFINFKYMTQIDPKDVINQADILLDDINLTNAQFANKTNKIISDVNAGFKAMDKINNDLEKVESQALADIDGQIIDHLSKTED